MSTVLEVLDNASLAALVGAAAAFFLVGANDWRRRRRIARVAIPALLRRLAELVEKRDGSLREAQASLKGGPPIRHIPLRFPVERLERLADGAMDCLTTPQASALDNVIFYMREADRVNQHALNLLGAVDEANSDPRAGPLGGRVQAPGLMRQARQRYSEEGALLAQIRSTLAAYLSRRLNESGGPLDEAK
jgi:hypothetical protein